MAEVAEVDGSRQPDDGPCMALLPKSVVGRKGKAGRTMPLGYACGLLGLEAIFLVSAFGAYYFATRASWRATEELGVQNEILHKKIDDLFRENHNIRWEHIHSKEVIDGLRQNNSQLRQDVGRLEDTQQQLIRDNAHAHMKAQELKQENAKLKDGLSSPCVSQDGAESGWGTVQGEAPGRRPGDNGSAHPFEDITGTSGHTLPEMYGKVKERTIWEYWYDPVNCSSSLECKLPPHIQLCVDTVNMNRGSFDFRLVRADEVQKYVSLYEIPVRWRDLTPQHQKDSLMNALLARYGGVALDITTILLRPIDDYWDEMVAAEATFRGYMYRTNGLPWRHPEVTAVWFLMSRREGLFSAAVRSQVIGMGDFNTTVHVYEQSYFALGDGTLTPILMMLNYSLPKCYEDRTLLEPKAVCPELESPPWYKALTGPPRNDARLLLRDPRDGPQLPFATLGMAGWDVENDTAPIPADVPGYPPVAERGGPMYRESCATMRECWEVFVQRYHAPARPGHARLLSFVKLFNAGKELEGLDKEQLLSNTRTYFFQWLKLAGLPLY